MTHDSFRFPGETYRGFTVVSHSYIEELDAYFRELIHTPTGARVMHIENKDPENLFCLSFQTLPKNSSGTPHILEHIVLCGSQRFPVKDPFFSMTRRSLNTFMNALTGSDFTCYPAASQVEKDFYNLLDVYLDAVFQPKLTKESFLQEGCRLEFEIPSDPSSPLRYKGIVYNEMKGSSASPETRMWHIVLEMLFPDLPYAHNSGGDPKEIPNLTYEELREFHTACYHPSRCIFFFYGNLPLKNHLDFLLEKTLDATLPLPPYPPIPLQPRFTSPKHRVERYPAHDSESGEQKTLIAFAWLTCPLTCQEDVLALSLLDSILADTDASPLKAALLDSGLCAQADAFIDTEMSEVPYAVICRGCEEDSADALEKVLKSTLEELSRKPIPDHLVQGAIHQLELSRMEISGDHSPFGLTLFFRSVPAKQHGCDPEKTLRMRYLFDTLLQKVQDPEYLPGIIKKYFLDNPHFVKVTMLPDTTLAEKEAREEERKLQVIRESLSPEEVKLIVERAKHPEKEKENLDCLPKVTLQDVPLLTRDFPMKKEKHSSLEVFHHDCFTNHIVYADFVFDLPRVAEEDIPYLHLLLSLLPELGAGGRNYKENLEILQRETGGIGASFGLHTHVTDNNLTNPAVSIRGKALARKAAGLFPLMQDCIGSPDLKDVKRVKELVKQLRTSLQNRLSKNAMQYAIRLALSGTGIGAEYQERCSGSSYYHFITKLAKQIEAQPTVVIDRLLKVYETIARFRNPTLILSCDGESYEKLKQTGGTECLLEEKPEIGSESPLSLRKTASQGRIIPSQVAYNVKAFPSVSYIHPKSPALMVATQLLENRVLHHKIREVGGAYGAGANYSPTLGAFYFHSHRDPHIKQTFSAFDESIEVIASEDFSEEHLEEAKLGVIQQFDLPVAPGSRAAIAYSRIRDGKTLALRQRYRDALLSLSRSDVAGAVDSELLSRKGEAVDVSFAGKEVFKKEGRESDSGFPVLPL